MFKPGDHVRIVHPVFEDRENTRQTVAGIDELTGWPTFRGQCKTFRVPSKWVVLDPA